MPLNPNQSILRACFISYWIRLDEKFCFNCQCLHCDLCCVLVYICSPYSLWKICVLWCTARFHTPTYLQLTNWLTSLILFVAHFFRDSVMNWYHKQFNIEQRANVGVGSTVCFGLSNPIKVQMPGESFVLAFVFLYAFWHLIIQKLSFSSDAFQTTM